MSIKMVSQEIHGVDDGAKRPSVHPPVRAYVHFGWSGLVLLNDVELSDVGGRGTGICQFLVGLTHSYYHEDGL